MILVAKAIIHKGAVMIEALDALIAVVTVHCVLWSKILAINADIVKVQLFID